MAADDKLVSALLDRYGKTFAEEVGIRLKDTPAPLFQLLYDSLLFSARISAGNAARATKALIDAGYTTPKKMADATWQQRVDVITWHGYKRYDERTATMLGDTAERLLERYGGDLRRLREETERDPRQELRSLQQFSGVGEVGASIFLREVQLVWEEAFPYVDGRVRDAARRLKLPRSPEGLKKLVRTRVDFVRLTAALVRCHLDDGYGEIRQAA